MSAPGGTGRDDHSHRQAFFAFEEYRTLVEDMGKLSDRRQFVNTLFVSINTIFLTGVGFLLYRFGAAFGDSNQAFLFTVGFLAIAIITTILNGAWKRIGHQYRDLVNLRIRYLEQIEAFLRGSAFFPTIEVPLKETEKLVEEPPAGMYDHISRHVDSSEEAGVQAWNAAHPNEPPKSAAAKRWMNTRGTYTLEEVLYGNPNKKFRAASFTDSEQRIVRTFTIAYWAAFAVSALALALLIVQFFGNFTIPLGPFHL